MKIIDIREIAEYHEGPIRFLRPYRTHLEKYDAIGMVRQMGFKVLKYGDFSGYNALIRVEPYLEESEIWDFAVQLDGLT